MKLETKIKIWEHIANIAKCAEALAEEREKVICEFTGDLNSREALRKSIRNPVPETLEMINDILQQMNKEG